MTTTPDGGGGPRLRPLALGEILDVAFKICFKHWRTLLKAVLVVVMPVQIVSTILTADYTVESFELGSDDSQSARETLDQFNEYLGGLAISTTLQICAVMLATAACFRAIAQVYLGEQPDWRSSLSYALRLTPALLGLTLLYVIGVGLGTLLFVMPGIWLYIAWAFALPVRLVEGARGTGALGRSFELVKGRWWRTFAVIALGFILATIIATVVQGVFLVGIFAGEDNDTLVLVLSAIAGIVGLAISTPVQAALLTVVYFDLRVRKEGFDLEQLAQGIGGTVTGAGGLPQVAEQPPAQPPPMAPGAAAEGALWPSPQAQAQAPAPATPAEPPPPPGWAPPRASPTRRDDDDADEPPRLPGVPHG